jgi:hypothetical protein
MRRLAHTHNQPVLTSNRLYAVAQFFAIQIDAAFPVACVEANGYMALASALT